MTSPIAGDREARERASFEAWYVDFYREPVPAEYRIIDIWQCWLARAALLEPVGEGWQPISTAPQSPKPILVYNQNGRVAIETGHFMHHMMHAAKVDGEECFYTHWHPLPASPKTNGGMGS